MYLSFVPASPFLPEHPVKRILFFCTLLITSLAHAGMAMAKELSLEQLVGQSSLIVVAAQDSPSFAPRFADLGANREGYPYNVLRFRVLETLKGGSEPTDSTKIDVVDSYLELFIHMTKFDQSRSFYLDQFAAGRGLLGTRKPLILFLQQKNERGENPFVAVDACLPYARKKSVKKLISRQP